MVKGGYARQDTLASQSNPAIGGEWARRWPVMEAMKMEMRFPPA